MDGTPHLKILPESLRMLTKDDIWLKYELLLPNKQTEVPLYYKLHSVNLSSLMLHSTQTLCNLFVQDFNISHS